MIRQKIVSLAMASVALAALAGLLVSCDHEDGEISGPSTGPNPPTSPDSPPDRRGATSPAYTASEPSVFALKLVSYSDCSGLLKAVQAAALERVGPYGFEEVNDWRNPNVRVQEDALVEFSQDSSVSAGDVPEPAPAAPALSPVTPTTAAPPPTTTRSAAQGAAAEAAPPAAAAGPSADILSDEGSSGAAESAPEQGVDFSGTNVQVEGVDEADIIKTDGRRIIVSSGEWVTVVDVTGSEPEITGRVNVPNNNASEMLFYRDRVLLLSTGWGNIRPLAEERSSDGEIARSSFWRPESSMLSITEVLLDETPRRGNTLQIEGGYLSSRSIGGTAHVVFNYYPGELGFVVPQNSRSQSSLDVATQANRLAVQNTTLADWLPQYRTISADGSVREEGQLLNCSRVNTPSRFNTFSTLGVLTLDLTNALEKGVASATFAGGQIVYSSTENLYVVTDTPVPQLFWENQESRAELENQYRTSIHKFSLGSGGAKYQASGSVKGHLLNQFSMNEYDDHLFVAATDGSPWGGNSESFIHSLTQEEQNLVNVGSVGNMGRGERIYSVRFIADRGYVVTFRQVDPLYVVDLSDPAEMRVLGELKIPGYSAYLHPISSDLLAGVGADATSTGRITGAKVSLFDVSDPANPRELDNWVLADAQSNVEWDHRAFLWWEPQKALVVPVQSWNNPDRNGALVLDVDRDDGISLRGTIQHDTSKDNYYNYIYHIIRSLVIGDDLWTLSSAILQSNDFTSLELNDRLRLPN